MFNLSKKLKIEKKQGLNKYRKFNKKKLKKIILYTFLGFFIFIVILFAVYSKDLPTAGKLRDISPVESSKIYDRNGKVLYDIHGDVKRTVLPKEEIPEIVKQATVAAEDKKFYKHFGFDIKALARSVIVNIFNRGYAQGGSTITQQYVKNALLSPKKTMDRKIKELILSLEIEVMFSKDEILSLYLNEIPYGSNIYGIEEASKSYYGKPAKELSLDEAAMLAALPQAPTYYSPYGQNPDKLLARRNYVIDNMVELNYISSEEAKDTKEKEIKVVEFKEDINAPHFVMYVRSKLIEMYGEKMVMEGGLKVTTTLDLDLQNKAEEAVKEGHKKNLSYGATNDALVAIDPKTGQILAMAGSHDYFDTDNDGQVNVTISDRQPGSSFKPIAYATAFKQHYNPASTLWDVTTDFGNYTPANYDGSTRGPVSIRFALANSLNIPAVKILYLAGIDNVMKTAKDLGITTLNNPEQYGLSLVLGGGEVKPLEMAGAFGVFANKGTKYETTPFLKIEDNHNNQLYDYEKEKNKKEVIDPQICYQISSILSDNNARSTVFGPNSALNFADRFVAAKTGTTDSFKDAWTVGYTPSIAVAVWVGNNDGTPMYKHADGSIVAAPIFRNFMLKYLEGKENELLERPEGIVDFTVDKLSGKIPTDQSPEKITDIFASWQVPKEYDDIHIKVKICKACEGEKLADENCPESQIEERTYTNLHSEVPDNPNWENPVRSYAEKMGMSLGSPPKEKCDVSNLKPSINITNPTNNEQISGKFSISATANSNFGINRVEFFIDNVLFETVYNSPFSTNYDSKLLSAGNHQITVKVIDNKDFTATNSITINVFKDLNPPSPVSAVTTTPSTKSVKIAWTNPNDTDLSSVRIYVSTINGNLGIKNTELAVTPNTNSSTTINNLLTGILYYFTLRPVDNSGNENQSTTQYTATPL